jgi:hypothetical protein
MKSPLQRLYKTKLALLATSATAIGIALLVLGHWVALQLGWDWAKNLPVTDIGSALFTSGLIVIFFEYIDQEDAEARADERLRRVLTDAAPAIRDSVVAGFAAAPDSLAEVASPATLDRIIENCLTLRLDDRELAVDAYVDLREQASRSKAHWSDAYISVVLSPWTKGPASGLGAMFVATIKWEYHVALDNTIMRFSCVSDLDDYRNLLQDPTSVAAWYFQPIAGLNGASPEAFQLIQFTIDGELVTPRRTTRTRDQTFTVAIPPERVTGQRQVALSYTQRVLVQQNGHLLHLDLSHPVKGLNVEFRYGDCGIRYVNVLDYVAGASQPHVTQLPASDLTPSVAVSYDGWVFPKGGVAFVWVLDSELPASAI